MKILVINCGSSSLKYQLINMETEEVMAKGNCEKIGLNDSFHKHKTASGIEVTYTNPLPTHAEAMKSVLASLTDEKVGVIKSPFISFPLYTCKLRPDASFHKEFTYIL